MAQENFSLQGVLLRLVASLALVFATWNAEGWSYYHWAIAPLIGGQIVASLGYGWLFMLGALASVLALPLLGPGAAPPARSQEH